MACEFDHLFILTDIDAPEADRLISLGLHEGSANIHPGQGTTNRRFFFDNAMLELLWVHHPAEAMSAPIQRTRIWERWQDRNNGACPFGVCVRPAAATEDTIAFANWAYQPPYLPATTSIAVGTNSQVLTEPMLFQIPFGQRPDRFPTAKAQPLAHPVGWREITRVELVSPHLDRSPELQTFVDLNIINIRSGAEYLIELGFDGEVQGQQVDLQPGLPLMMSW